MRQLIVDDYNGLQGLIDLVEQAARERDDIHFRVVNTDTNCAQTRKPMEISMSITIKADKDDFTALKESEDNKPTPLNVQEIEKTVLSCLERVLQPTNAKSNQKVQELLVQKLKEGTETTVHRSNVGHGITDTNNFKISHK
ncbi:MAG: hypothetical protein II852_01690 [Bacteroidales bacterium]|nr:hypothetical protein [Bacteroidales bacterium]